MLVVFVFSFLFVFWGMLVYSKTCCFTEVVVWIIDFAGIRY